MKSLKEINVLKYLLLGLGLLYICFYIFIALSRLNYPFELEGVEGAIVDQVRKILEEGKLYTQPSLKFTPFMYPPLYFYIGAILFKVFGEGFLALRLISFFSSLGILILIFKFLKREGANSFYSLLAACFFASTYPLSGAWMDLARIDSLFVLLLGITFYLLRFKPTKLGYLVAGIFASLAFFTKQITFLILLPLMFYTVLKDKKKGFYFPFSFICIVIPISLILDYIHEGWYLYYTLYLPLHHPWLKIALLRFWTIDVFLFLPIAFLFSTFYIFSKYKENEKYTSLFYLSMLAGLMAGSWLLRLHVGGYLNVLMPMHLGFAICFGLGLKEAMDLSRYLPEAKCTLLRVLICLAGLIQFLAMEYNPLDYIPNKEDLKFGFHFLNFIKEIEGEILIPDHGYIPKLAGKRSYAHYLAINDVIKGDGCGFGAALIEEIKDHLKNHKFSAILLDEPSLKEVDIDKYYRGMRIPYKMRTKFKVWPEYIYLPKK